MASHPSAKLGKRLRSEMTNPFLARRASSSPRSARELDWRACIAGGDGIALGRRLGGAGGIGASPVWIFAVDVREVSGAGWMFVLAAREAGGGGGWHATATAHATTSNTRGARRG